jgi:hypothetical protein
LTVPLLLTASDDSFISLAEVKEQANVKTAAHDDELDLFRGAAQEAVEGLIGPVLHRTYTEVYTGGGAIVLRHSPVLSVDAVSNAGVTLTHTADVESGIVYARAYGPVTVTYTAGRAVVPDSVRVAALIIAEHLWTTQRGTAPSLVQGEEAAPAPGMAYSIPNRATDLLRPYLLPPVVG